MSVNFKPRIDEFESTKIVPRAPRVRQAGTSFPVAPPGQDKIFGATPPDAILMPGKGF
jgi:hypothetical protein